MTKSLSRATRHFDHVPEERRAELFYRQPEAFDLTSHKDILATGLGATLYTPSTRERLAERFDRLARLGVKSMVVDLEDAIADQDVARGEQNLVEAFEAHRVALERGEAETPLLFVRVRHPDQILDLVDRMGESVHILSGFALPKFSAFNCEPYLEAVVQASQQSGHHLWVMPILESPELIFLETRVQALIDARALLNKYYAHVLAIRIGATDLSGVYGLRRGQDQTIYDVRIVADVMAMIVNVFGRDGEFPYTITGPVWEYFGPHERMFRPQLRQSPFASHDAESLRRELIASDLDGLLREVELDKANGLTGKTVIHPTHVDAVHTLLVVSREEYTDAVSTQSQNEAGGGVLSSEYRNKMNEAKPHRAWSERIVRRAEVYGVAEKNVSFVDLLAAASPK